MAGVFRIVVTEAHILYYANMVVPDKYRVSFTKCALNMISSKGGSTQYLLEDDEAHRVLIQVINDIDWRVSGELDNFWVELINYLLKSRECEGIEWVNSTELFDLSSIDIPHSHTSHTSNASTTPHTFIGGKRKVRVEKVRIDLEDPDNIYLADLPREHPYRNQPVAGLYHRWHCWKGEDVTHDVNDRDRWWGASPWSLIPLKQHNPRPIAHMSYNELEDAGGFWTKSSDWSKTKLPARKRGDLTPPN